LVGKDGVPIKRYAPTDKPESIAPDIEAALG
jgi:glutathione peroxidase